MILSGLALGLMACTAGPPTQEFASENGISIKYKAYDSVPTLTAQAREMAVQHCAQYGKYANYRGGNAVSPVSAEEVHQFACERKKTDDSVVLAAQSQRPTYVPVPDYQSQSPTQTNCRPDYLGGLNCTTY